MTRDEFLDSTREQIQYAMEGVSLNEKMKADAIKESTGRKGKKMAAPVKEIDYANLERKVAQMRGAAFEVKHGKKGKKV